jgi:hypothetical protein
MKSILEFIGYILLGLLILIGMGTLGPILVPLAFVFVVVVALMDEQESSKHCVKHKVKWFTENTMSSKQLERFNTMMNRK